MRRDEEDRSRRQRDGPFALTLAVCEVECVGCRARLVPECILALLAVEDLLQSSDTGAPGVPSAISHSQSAHLNEDGGA
jgi:hypothetical protein